jgi:hypothetical protein
MQKIANLQILICVESDGSKNLEPDIPADSADSPLSKSPQSALAEKMTVRF